MAKRVTEQEIKTATAMAERKSGVTRQQLAARLKVKPDRAKVILEAHAMRVGSWSTSTKGAGRDNRTTIYTRAKTSSGARPTARGRKKKVAARRHKTKAKAKRSRAGRKPRKRTAGK